MRFSAARTTVAIMESSLAGAIGVHGRPAFLNAVDVTIPVSRRRCYNHRNTLASGWHRPGKRITF